MLAMRKSPQGPNPQNSQINKYLKYIATTIAFFLATWQEVLPQQIKNDKDPVSVEVIDNNLKYEVLQSYAKQIIKKYGEEKGLELLVYYMVEKINEIRKDSLLPPLIIDTTMNAVAQKYAQYLADNKHYSHIDLSGKNWKDRLRKGGYTGTVIGENLSRSSTAWWAIGSIKHKEWRMRSDWHRDNLLDSSANSVWIWYVHIQRPWAKPSYPMEEDNYFVLVVGRQ